MFYSTVFPSPIGMITLACDSGGKTLAGLWLEGQKYHGDTIPEALTTKNDMSIFTAAKKWLYKYFAGEKPAISELPLAPIGGEFRQGVWNILCEIPYGGIIT